MRIATTTASDDGEMTTANIVMTTMTTTIAMTGAAADDVTSISTLATSERNGMERILRRSVEPAIATQR